MSELAEWLQTVNATGSKTLQTVIPEDMLVYFTQHWLPNHASSATKFLNRGAHSSTKQLGRHQVTPGHRV